MNVNAGDGVFPFDYQRVDLKNGFKAYLIDGGAPGSFTYVTMVRTGSRDEYEEGKTGFAHFFEHMMFRGTDKYPQFDDIIAKMGAASNAFTSNDMTVFYITAASEYLEQVFDLESDRFMNLNYSEEQFKTEAGAVLGEYQQGKYSPYRFLDERVREVAFDAHTYQHTTIGFEEDVRNMPNGYDYSRSFHERYYRPENCVLVLVGDFDSVAAKKYLKTFYGDWDKGYSPPPIPKEPPQTAPRQALALYPSRTLPILTMNYKAPAWSQTDRLAVATEVLGQLAFGSNSDLYKKLVLDEQRLQSLNALFSLARDPGLVSVAATVLDPADLSAIRAEIESTIARFQSSKVEASELDNVKANVKYGFLMGLETSRSIAFSLIPFVINTGQIETIESYFNTLDQVTPKDVQEAALKFLTRNRQTVVTMVQKGTEDALSANQDLIELRDDASPYVAFNIWVKAGSQDDPVGKAGLASLTANLLDDSGTQSVPYQDILEKLYPMAASYRVSVDKEMTVFTGRVHRDNLEEYYALFRDHILDPGFAVEDFARVKNGTMNFVERLRRYSRDEELTKELLMSRIFAATPYGHPEEGYVESVQNLSIDDVKQFYKSYYTRDRVVVAVGGDCPDGFAERVRRDFDRLPVGKSEATQAPEPHDLDGIKLLLVDKNTNAAPISIGFPTELRRDHPDYFPMMVVNSWFGEHRNSFSHLYQVIREERGMNYGDYSYIEAFPLGYTTQRPPVNVARRQQIFEIWVRPVSEKKPDTLHDQTLFALRAALRELHQLVDEGIAPEDVERAKTFLSNFTVTYAETLQRRLDYAVDDAFYGLDPGYLSSLKDGIAAVTPESANAAIKRHLQAKDMQIVIVTADAEGLKKKILSGEPTMLTYGGDQPAQLAGEDAEIAAFPIPISEDDIEIVSVDDVYQSAPGATSSSTDGSQP